MEARGWIVVVAVIALAVLLAGFCVCGMFGYLVSTAPETDLADERAEQDGALAGQRGTSDDCIALGHDRTVDCGMLAFDCANHAEAFVRACLRAVPSPDPAVCDGVPEPSALGDFDFADTLCRAHGWSPDTGDCDPIADGLSVYCHGQP
jgi:hypothetical protein